LLAEFADHFFVAARTQGAASAPSIWPRLRPPATEVAWHCAARREFPVTTVFELADGGVTVRKERADGREAGDAGPFHWRLPPPAPLAAGEPFRLRLEAHLAAERSDRFLDELAELFAAVQRSFRRGTELSGEALDATLSNATRDREGAFHLFDLEWRAPEGVAASWWVLRNVLACIEMRGAGMPGVASGAQLYARLCQRLGVAADLDADLARESAFATAASGSQQGAEPSALAALLARPWPTPTAQGADTATFRSAIELASSFRRLERWAEELQQANAVAAADYQRLESWASEVQRANTAAVADYRRLEEWAAEVERSRAAALGDYRKLEAWAASLAAELEQRKAASRS
jgi:hypothetical protein